MAAFKMGEFKIADEYANKVLKLEPSSAQAINLLASANLTKFCIADSRCVLNKSNPFDLYLIIMDKLSSVKLCVPANNGF
jgi:hypothetical protein